MLSNQIHPLLFLLTELSTSSQQVRPRNLDSLRDVRFYADLYGNLIPLIDETIDRMVRARFVIFGIYTIGFIRPVYDANRLQVVVRLNNNQNVRITIALKRRYSRFFQWQRRIITRSRIY